MALKQITAPTTYPVTLAEVKLHCRIDTNDEDTLVNALITAATEAAEHATGRAIMPQTWELTLDAFPDAFELTRVPVVSITSVKYYDAAGVQQTLASSKLDNVDDFGFAYVVPAYGEVWPDTQDQINAVAVRFVAGYADAASVPQSIKQWILLQVGAMYESRESESVGAGQVQKLGFVDALMARYKVWS